MKHIAVVLLSLLLGGLGFAEQTTPVFQDQPCVVVQPRSGIGNTIAKLKAGQAVTIAYFGGSITAADGWRPKTTQWLKEQYPEAKITEVHAAIGGTGSDLGVYRNKHDVLDFKPDLVFVEFSVNDGGASPENIWRQIEGIVRQIWSDNPNTDIVFTYTFIKGYLEQTQAGQCSRAAASMEMLAQFYGIPSINFCPRIAEMEKQGQLVIKDEGNTKPGQIIFSGDNVHPTDAGHELYMKDIKIGWKAMENIPAVNHAPLLEKTFIADNYQNAKMVDITPEMLSGTWRQIEQHDSLHRFANRMGEIWTSGTPGSTVSFKAKASQIKLYDLIGPDGGQVTVTVDGVESKLMPLFDSYCVYHRLATLVCAGNLDTNTVHTVVVKIDKDQPDRKAVAFRLKDPEKELAEPKFQGTNVWFGKIMITGDLVK